METGERRRLDQAMVERELADSRSRARALIEAGLVTLDGAVADKPSRPVTEATEIRVTGLDHPWVSRGGVKLVHALDQFAIEVAGRVALDIGASTGGFTDVLLARGVAKVYAVDVGHDQLAPKLRADPRVLVLERVNARYLTAAEVPEPVSLLVSDASFIGLEVLLPASLDRAAPEADLIALIKPQFEVGPKRVGKGGVVKDPALHQATCQRISDWLDAQPGWRVMGLLESPIRGPEGNVEFLIHAHRTEEAAP
ncbi:MAG TPA: TlyA family RNA methyltransferase [Aliidongia sp.]|uniref:TlyA family RNA methyltransferase n=1 Tax=Aliidongia sp. TaxID=1914230 RepID=UPI002DDDABA0|nr:TlyA family RNA methyltransferase [Aliidongia sp.]HEV2677260.1 TlyA family RNA methyltransferase [Aliidongia sp.]